ncbi:hypothetical protein TWF696_006991 [Orbilia brochopaga]|uniref:Macro domain-containing protein n=1 Tax=Orbilia brochopaga TaxID=3140254 RepID=A0AAV9UU49_9PEZI
MALHSYGKPPIPVDTLSTVTKLYAEGRLDASIATPSTLPPSAKFNDMVILVQMDLTRLDCDAIVNAANKSLLGGGGIDGAIHRVAGPRLYDECLDLRGCETGEAKITKGYKLPARHIIHTVGPVYWTHKDKGEDPGILLKSCYTASLDLARQNGCETVAFPCISTGIYGYPSRHAAIVACQTVREYLEAQEREDADAKKEVKEEEEKKDGQVEEEEGGVKLVAEDNDKAGKENKPGATPVAAPSTPPAGVADSKAKTSIKREKTAEEKKPMLTKIKKVVFCTFLDKDLAAYDNVVPAYFPPVEGVEGSLDKLAAEVAQSQAATDEDSKDAKTQADAKDNVEAEDKGDVKTDDKTEDKN